MPAALEVDGLQVVAVAEEYNPARVDEFLAEYPQLEVAEDFEQLIARPDLDALYVPQPPALHYRWARAALEAGKHVLVEKPSTTSLAESRELVELARTRGLALHENYMFRYHAQIAQVQDLIAQGVIGDVRLYRADFGFPLRAANDFRYNRALGGGALLDAGGYALALASLMLGPSARITTAELRTLPGYEVDMVGSATLVNSAGDVFQLGFGMDCGYRCSLEVWGSTGTLTTNRIFTAPPGFVPTATIRTNEGERTVELAADAHFQKSIASFVAQTGSAEEREASYARIVHQAQLVEDVRRLAAAQ